MAKSMKPGGGGRFQKLTKKLESQGKSADSAAGIAAKVGREKYGKKKFSSMASKGRARAKK